MSKSIDTLDPVIDRQRETAIDRQPPAPIDRRAPLTYRVQMPKIDVACLNALRPQPKPSDNPPEATNIHSDDATDPMEVYRVPMGRTLRKRKENVIIDDPGLIASCHCGSEYETEYSASIETHTATSIDNAQQKSIDSLKEESVESSPSNWENDYYNPTMAAYRGEYAVDRHNRLTIDRHSYSSDKPKNEHRPTFPTTHQSTLESTVHEKGTRVAVGQMITITKVMQSTPSRSFWERTRFSHPIDKANHSLIDDKSKSSIDNRPKPPSTVSKKNPNYDNQYLTQDEFGIFRDPDGYARAIDGHALQISREDIADILQMANGADNLFMQQHTVLAHQQRVTNEFYDTPGGIDNCFKQKYRHPTRPSIDIDVPSLIDRRPEFGRRAYDLYGTRRFHWEEKDEYEVYRDHQGYARYVD
ncbi:hypothetical protein F2Q69_00035390 [Brassica cretica]|uniref:Uncharacterized protein n=1 Tax=Brassica cretica TaxID=69181 RepID=A0A8S9SPP8_BRACR|nr:hypothetical protein F2Q69_00035390 [Brassica cretica]